MSVKVKICGIRSLEAAKAAIDAGADFLGFNFVPSSKRYIDPNIAKKIIEQIEGKVKMVGVFQNAKVFEISRIASDLRLDFVQLHGDEDDKYITQIKFPIIKTINVYSKPNEINTKYLLIDRENRDKAKVVDQDKARMIARGYPVFLAGGLTPENVADAVERVSPFGVDVAGGVETNGKQDLKKIRAFIKNAKGKI